MATFYLDFENGNDASAGTSWATAWKTLNNGATAARIAPGDEIRIAKTADPTSIGNGTWTNKSATVTLATAQTTNIYLDGSWTAANSGSATTTTTRKEGSNAASITTAATTATSTKYAYLTIGGGAGVDFSSYDAITFWIQSASVAINANNYQIKLCSDTIGNTAVDTFDIPATAGTGVWIPMTLKRVGGGALGNSIQSIAWYTGTSNPGNSRNVFIDNVLGCDFDGLNLTSLISKNSAGFTDLSTANSWHGLQSINGTTIILGNRNSEIAGDAVLRGYSTTGTSPETVTTYIRPTYKFAIQSSTTGSAQPIQDSGTAGNQITFSGGWNTSSNVQDGETWIDGQNGQGYGIDINSRQYITITRLSTCRFNRGIFLNLSRIGLNINNLSCINNTFGFTGECVSSTINIFINNNNFGIFVNQITSVDNNLFTFKILNNSSSTNYGKNNKFTNLIFNNNGSDLTTATSFIDYLGAEDNFGNITVASSEKIFIKEAVIKNNTGSGTLKGGDSLLQINKLTASNNTNIGTYNGDLVVLQTNATSSQLLGSSSTGTTRAFYYPSVRYNAINNDINDNRTFWLYGNALSQTTTRKTASGIAWQINITDTKQTSTVPFYFPIAKVACNANSLVTVKAWVKLSNATNIGAKLLIQANEIAGVTADVTATKSADTNWEELTITFTPTVAGVAQIYIQAYWIASTANQSVYVDDITVTQA